MFLKDVTGCRAVNANFIRTLELVVEESNGTVHSSEQNSDFTSVIDTTMCDFKIEAWMDVGQPVVIWSNKAPFNATELTNAKIKLQSLADGFVPQVA